MKKSNVPGVVAAVGTVFTLVGGTFFAIGVWLAVNADWITRQEKLGNITVEGNMPDSVFNMMFMGMGGLFLCMGLGMLVFYISGMRHAKRLIATGRELLAEVISVEEDWSFLVNDQPTAMVFCLYEGHEFRTGGISWKYIPRMPGQMFVKLYVGDTWDDFYIDVSTMHVVEPTAY